MSTFKSPSEYAIDETSGFLSPSMEVPLPKDYEAWEILASSIPHLLLGGKLRPYIEKVHTPLVPLSHTL